MRRIGSAGVAVHRGCVPAVLTQLDFSMWLCGLLFCRAPVHSKCCGPPLRRKLRGRKQASTAAYRSTAEIVGNESAVSNPRNRTELPAGSRSCERGSLSAFPEKRVDSQIPGTQHFHSGLSDPQFGTAGTSRGRDDRPGFRCCPRGVISQRPRRKQPHCPAIAWSTAEHSAMVSHQAVFSYTLCQYSPPRVLRKPILIQSTTIALCEPEPIHGHQEI